MCFAVLLSLVIYACKKPTEGLELIIKTDALSKSPTLIEYVNANPRGTAIPAKMAVTITDPLKVVQAEDGATTIFTAYNGLLPLSLIRTATPSVATPVKFTITAAPAGFLSVVSTINITSDTAAINTVVPLIEYARPPAGTSVLVTTTALTGGTSGLQTLNIPATAPTEACTITIAAGTQVKDKNGSVINANSLVSNIVHLGTTTQDAYNAFPGGFNPSNIIGPDGSAIPKGATFVTAGLVSIRMLAGGTSGTAVKSFSKPVTVNMGINPKLINPLTGVLVKVGDVIPIWSLDEDSGQWTYEATAKVIKNADGSLAIVFSVSHLSAWNVDWYGTACGSSLSVTVKISGLPTGLGLDGYELFLATANDQYLGGLYTDNSWSHTVTLYNGFMATLPVVPANLGNVKMVIYSRRGDPTSKISESALFNPCSTSSIPVSMTAPLIPDLIKSHINLVAKCTSKQIVAYPTAWLVLKDVTDPTAVITANVHMVNGIVDVKLISGHTYTLGTVYNGRSFSSGSFKVDRTSNPQIPSSTGLSGTAVYDAPSQTLNINTLFTLTSCG